MPKKKSRKPKRKTSVSVRAKVSPLEQNVKHFEAEVNALGKQMRIKGEELGKRAEKRREKYRSTRHQAFGILGPLLSAVFGIACLSLGIWALDLIAQRSGTVIMSSGVRYFLLSNLWLFFLIFLASAFASYCSRACPHT